MHINFNSPPQSYWMASTPSTDYEKLNKDIKTDVAIIGGGIVGILTGYLLSRQGIKACVFEADKILQGTTGHTTAKITSLHDLGYQKINELMSREFAQQYADANQTAIKMIKNIADENNIDCDYNIESSYVFTQQEDYIKKIEKEAQIASELGIDASYIDSIPLPINVKAAVRFDNQARFHPRKFLLPLAEKFIENKNNIYEQTRIVDLEIENNIFCLRTSDNLKIIAEKVIIASHYPFYNKAGLYFTRLYPERSYSVAFKMTEKYPGGMYINAEDPARSIRCQETDSGEELYIIGGEHHKPGQGEDTISHYKALVDFSNRNFKVKDIVCRWSTQDCMSVDDVPLIGQMLSDTPNLYVATGFNKWGMSNGMVSAMLLSDLIQNKHNAWHEVYNPSRHTILAAAKNFVVENANVAKELIKGKVESIPDNANIERGEGRIIDVDGNRAGAYLDEQEKLHIVNTTCPHMGCELKWNSAEKSWDCPCHGSRFTYDGDIIEGPAVRRLELNEHTKTIEKLIKDEY